MKKSALTAQLCPVAGPQPHQSKPLPAHRIAIAYGATRLELSSTSFQKIAPNEVRKRLFISTGSFPLVNQIKVIVFEGRGRRSKLFARSRSFRDHSQVRQSA